VLITFFDARAGGDGMLGAVRNGLSRRRFLLIAVLVLAAVCMGVAEESFAHTDDGCPVETHCLACRLATGTIAVLAVATPAILRIADCPQRIWTETPQSRSESPVAITPSRAPPFA
jgi:hypothetical protein